MQELISDGSWLLSELRELYSTMLYSVVHSIKCRLAIHNVYVARENSGYTSVEVMLYV